MGQSWCGTIHLKKERNKRSEQLNDVDKPCLKEESGLGRCKEHCGKCEYIV